MKSMAKTFGLALMVGLWTALFTLGVLYLVDGRVAFSFETAINERLDRLDAAGGGDVSGRLETLETKIEDMGSALEGAVAAIDAAVERLEGGSMPQQASMSAGAAAAMKTPVPMGAADEAGEPSLVVVIDFPVPGSFDGAWLEGTVTAKAEELTAAAEGRTGCVIDIAGHADTVGGDRANEALSAKRADAVGRHLLAALEAAGRADDFTLVQPRAWGERRLAVLTPDATAERANRRAEISVRCPGGAKVMS